MTRPTPVPSQKSAPCKHRRTYYDEKGLRCKDCHQYLPRKLLLRKESGSDGHDG